MWCFLSVGQEVGPTKLSKLSWMLLKLWAVNTDVLCSAQITGMINFTVESYIKNYLVLICIKLSATIAPKMQSFCSFH